MEFCFDKQMSLYQKLFKSDHPLQICKQIKESNLGGVVPECAIFALLLTPADSHSP